MNQIESFPSEALLIDQIERHLADGVEETQMRVLANTELKKVKSEYRNIHNETKEVGPLAQFLSIFATRSREEKEIDKLDLNEEQKYICRKALEDNQIVLYVEGI